jgi:hypothetical protein
MRIRIGFVFAAALVLGGCLADGTEVPREEDEGMITGQGREFTSSRVAGRADTLAAPEFRQAVFDRAGWLDNALNDGADVTIGPKIPFKAKPDLPR